MAAPWTPKASLVDQCGRIGLDVIWAALDYPGAIAIMGKQPKSIALGAYDGPNRCVRFCR